MYSLNTTILYIYITYYVFLDMPLLWAYHHSSVYIYLPSLNTTRSFLNLHIITRLWYSIILPV